jgi:hypothetical protein
MPMGIRMDPFATPRAKMEAETRAIGAQQKLAREQFNWEQRRYWSEREREQQEWGITQGAMDQMVREYNRAYGIAATGEEQRYQQMLGIAEETTGQRAADIRADYTEQQSNAMQRLARLGMANTTVAPTMAMGYQREQQSALNRLADQMQQTKLGIIERRDPRYPKQEMLASMSRQLGYGGTAARAAAPLSGMRMG